MDTQEQTDRSKQLSTPSASLDTSMIHARRRERRALPRITKGNPLIGLINVMILVIGLTVILASRCDPPSPTQNHKAWLDHLIVPKDLHLPESVIDKQLKNTSLPHSSKRNELIK